MRAGAAKGSERPAILEHPWNVSPKDARSLQRNLRGRVKIAPLSRAPRTVAGADISHLRFGRRAVAGIVVFSFPGLEFLEESIVEGTIDFPYVPGLLSFREGPLLERAFRGLRRKPGLLFFDGQGIAHPRGLGIASHLGLRLEVPSVGCAKSRLFGEAAEPEEDKGAWTPIMDPGGGAVGALVRTRKGVKPVYVSPGHRIDVAGALRYALALSPRYRIPVPIRAAHMRTNEERRRRGIV